MNKSTILTLLGITALGFAKRSTGSRGVIQFEGLSSAEQIAIVDYYKNMEKAFINGIESVDQLAYKMKNNMYVYKYNYPKYGEIDIPILVVTNDISTHFFDLFYTDLQMPIHLQHAKIENGKYQLEPKSSLHESYELKQLLQKAHAEKPMEFYYDKNISNKIWQNYITKLEEYTRWAAENFDVNGIKFDIPEESIEQNLKNLAVPIFAPAWFNPSDKYAIVRPHTISFTLRHEIRHVLDAILGNRDIRTPYQLPRKYKYPNKQTGNNRFDPRKDTHAQFKPEFVTYIGDAYDDVVHSRHYRKSNLTWNETPTFESEDTKKVISYIMVNLFGKRNNSGIPSDKLLEMLPYNETIRRATSQKRGFQDMNYFNLLIIELYSAKYKALKEVFDRYKDFFYANYEPNRRLSWEK